MRNMISLLLFFVTYMNTTNAQFKVGQDIVGTPYESKHSDKFIGDVYLYSNWLNGHVLQEDDKHFNNMLLKYDIFNDRVIFNSPDSTPMLFKYPIKEFQLILNQFNKTSLLLFKNGFPPIGKYDSKNYYQVLTEGKTTFIKKLYKSVVETTNYGDSEKKKNFSTNESYFLHHKDKMIKLQRTEKAFLEALTDERAKLVSFIAEKKLKMKSEQDYVTVVNFYNTLK